MNPDGRQPARRPGGVEQRTVRLAGLPVVYRQAALTGAGVLYLHSVPTSSEDWAAFLAHTGGVAPDLPGFGCSARPVGFDYSLAGYVAFVDALVDALGIKEVMVVGHGWGGAIALAFAQRHPGRVTRLVIIDAVPLLEDFRWPRMVARWRMPVLGELIMASLTQRRLARTLRCGTVNPNAWSDEQIAAVWQQFDQDTQRAILGLHRSLESDQLADAGARLDVINAPVMVLWGERDPWLDPSFADAYAQALRRATVERVADAGHWPWRDQPTVIDRVTAFLHTETTPQ